MPRAVIVVAGEAFKSKDALLERIRRILYGTPPGFEVPPDHAAFLTAALAGADVHYAQDRGVPVKWQVRMQAMEMGGRFPEFVFARSDGSEENPSIRYLSRQKPIVGKGLVEAARMSIAAQVITFRDNSRQICQACNQYKRPLEVHHEPPAFAQIWKEYLASGVEEASMRVLETRDAKGVMTSYRLDDPHHGVFAEFHRQRARYRMLCLACHGDITHQRKTAP